GDVVAAALERFLHDAVFRLVHIDDAGEVFVLARGQVRAGAATAAADLDEPDFIASAGGVENVEGRGGEHTGGERRLFRERTTSEITFHSTIQWLIEMSVADAPRLRQHKAPPV